MNKTTKSTSTKENAKGCDNLKTREVSTVENLVSPPNATERPATLAKSTHHKKKETTDNHKAKKAAEVPLSLPKPR